MDFLTSNDRLRIIGTSNPRTVYVMAARSETILALWKGAHVNRSLAQGCFWVELHRATVWGCFARIQRGKVGPAPLTGDRRFVGIICEREPPVQLGVLAGRLL